MKSLFTILLIAISTISISQENWEWDEIIEQEGTTQDQNYSKCKMFIAETWKSANDVIQNDDKETGMILLKGKSMKNVVFSMNDHQYTFDYTVKLYQKDGKSRIVLNDVVCTRAYVPGGYTWPLLPVSDTYPEEKGMKKTGMTEKNYLKVMVPLKAEMQSIVDSFKSYMTKPIEKENDDW